MASYSDTVRDQYDRPVSGALVYIYTQAGDLVALRASSGGTLANPVRTDVDGAYSFDADDARYRRIIRLGALSLDTSDIIVGNPPEYVGPPGPQGPPSDGDLNGGFRSDFTTLDGGFR